MMLHDFDASDSLDGVDSDLDPPPACIDLMRSPDQVLAFATTRHLLALFGRKVRGDRIWLVNCLTSALPCRSRCGTIS
jgi:hypothetical protein